MLSSDHVLLLSVIRDAQDKVKKHCYCFVTCQQSRRRA